MESPKARVSKLKLFGKDEGAHPSVLERLFGLFPRHSAAPAANPPPGDKQKQFDHALKIQIVSWNMADTSPKGDLAALLGVIPPYDAQSSNTAASDFQLEDTGHPYHIIVVACQECPTWLLPRGMGTVNMGGPNKRKRKEHDNSPNKRKRTHQSEEEDSQSLTEPFPTNNSLPSTPTASTTNLSLSGLAQQSSGLTALLEGWYSKGLGAKQFWGGGRGLSNLPEMVVPPSPTLSRSSSLPALPRPSTTSTPAKSTATYPRYRTNSFGSDFSKSYVATGVGGMLGDKGGVGISLNIAGSSFLFINAHLAAHEGRQAMRIENMEKIQAGLTLKNFGNHTHPRKPISDSTKRDITDTFDYTFIFGDLNFRLNVSRLHADWLISRKGRFRSIVNPSIVNPSNRTKLSGSQPHQCFLIQCITGSSEYLRAQEFDELRTNMRSNKIFPGFEEPAINFPPTFKYDVPKSRRHARKYKEGREKGERPVVAGTSIRRSSKRSENKGKSKGEATQMEAKSMTVETDRDERASGRQKFQPIHKQETDVSSIGEGGTLDVDPDQEQEQTNYVSAFSGVAHASGYLSRLPSTRSRRWGVPRTHSRFSQPDTERHEHGGNDAAFVDGEDGDPRHNIQPNAEDAPSSILRKFTRGAKRTWRALIAWSTFVLGARIKSPTKCEPSGSRGGLAGLGDLSTRPEAVPALSTAATTNLVLDTGTSKFPENLRARARASIDGSRSDASAFGSPGAGRARSPWAMIRNNLSVRSITENSANAPADDSENSESIRGVYDTSSKQRVPSWCDRIVYKSMVLPPRPPPPISVSPFSVPFLGALHEDSRFHRVGNIFTGMGYRGSRRPKDSLPQATLHGDNHGGISVGHSDSPPSGSLEMSGKRPGSSSNQLGGAVSTGTTDEYQLDALGSPRTNPFVCLSLPHPHTPGSPGLINASMEPQPQPGVKPSPMLRPRSFSILKEREKGDDGAGSGLGASHELDGNSKNPRASPPLPPPFSSDDGILRFFRSLDQEPTVVVAEPGPEPEPEPEPDLEPAEGVEIRRRGDIVCVSYGTLDDREMRRLGSRSDHRPVVGACSGLAIKLALKTR